MPSYHITNLVPEVSGYRARDCSRPGSVVSICIARPNPPLDDDPEVEYHHSARPASRSMPMECDSQSHPGPAHISRCGLSSVPAAEEGVQVVGQGCGVGSCAVDVGGGAGAEHRQAEEVESGGAGDYAAVVADVAGAVAHGDVEPGLVRAKACRPQHGGDLPAGQVQFQGGAGMDA